MGHVIRLILLVAFAVSAAVAAAETRVALVIGNADYTRVSSLNNPGHDAEDMDRMLGELGFDTTLLRDASETAMTDAVEDFSRAASTADVALFFFAGHGFQVSGENLLAPVEFDLRQEATGQSLSLDDVISAMAGSPGIKIIILDACRNRPEDLIAGTDVESGFARVGNTAFGASSDFVVVYSTQPGAVAWDGAGRNGIFSGALLRHMGRPGRTLNQVLVSVRGDVIGITGGKQIPWETSSLTRDVILRSGLPPVSIETQLFQAAAKSGNPRLLAFYLEYFPESAHAAEARALLNGSIPEELRVADASQASAAVLPLARQMSSRSLAELYIEEYPNAPDTAAARLLLRQLGSAQTESPATLCQRLATHPGDASTEFPGTSTAALGRHAERAREACEAAVAAHPGRPQFKALLARVHVALNNPDDAVRLFREASAAGDVRAITSLAHLTYNGQWIAQDKEAAFDLYKIAADAGSPDAAVNVAFELLADTPTPEEEAEAIGYLEAAYENGSAGAAYNLGYLASSGRYGERSRALTLFLEAGHRGEPQGFRFAAQIYQHGDEVAPDPEKAADFLLRAALEDDGYVVGEFNRRADLWLPSTIRAVQERLTTAGLLAVPADGVAGPETARAITRWRHGGYRPGVLQN